MTESLLDGFYYQREHCHEGDIRVGNIITFARSNNIAAEGDNLATGEVLAIHENSTGHMFFTVHSKDITDRTINVSQDVIRSVDLSPEQEEEIKQMKEL